jgi:hypothetical protein
MSREEDLADLTRWLDGMSQQFLRMAGGDNNRYTVALDTMIVCADNLFMASCDHLPELRRFLIALAKNATSETHNSQVRETEMSELIDARAALLDALGPPPTRAAPSIHAN